MRSVIGGWALLASSTPLPRSDQAAQMRPASQAGCAVCAARSVSMRARSPARSMTNRRSTALTRPLLRAAASTRAASTAACTVASGALREYSSWCAPAASSARMRRGTPAGRSRSRSIAGARRRYQRSVPRAIARTAERSGDSGRLRERHIGGLAAEDHGIDRAGGGCERGRPRRPGRSSQAAAPRGSGPERSRVRSPAGVPAAAPR